MTARDERDAYGEFDAMVDAYDGQTHWFDQGYHATFRFWRASKPREGDHAYRYELVLHDPEGKRIMGYDNAHPVKWGSGKFTKHGEHPDHFDRTQSDKGRPYKFVSLTQLFDDFYARVEKALKELNLPSDITRATRT